MFPPFVDAGCCVFVCNVSGKDTYVIYKNTVSHGNLTEVFNVTDRCWRVVGRPVLRFICWSASKTGDRGSPSCQLTRPTKAPNLPKRSLPRKSWRLALLSRPHLIPRRRCRTKSTLYRSLQRGNAMNSVGTTLPELHALTSARAL